MFPFFSYDHNTCNNYLFFLLLLFSGYVSTARARLDPFTDITGTTTATMDLENATWHGFIRFLDAGKGSQMDGLSELKRYFERFGYLSSGKEENFNDLFDEDLESALMMYQGKLGLSKTGKLDFDTMEAIVSPRCGVMDMRNGDNNMHVTKHYAYFYGEPRWTRTFASPFNLSYAFSPKDMIDYISLPELKSAFQRAFTRWSQVIPVNFTEAEDYSLADIKIGFYHGDHGDGEAFDGVLGVLAHAFSPENGRFHLDASEKWAVDFKSEKSKEAIDLESVATHEIGHVLGLAHSSVKEAVMYPSLSPRTKKVNLRIDDVEGIQALYGSNPNFRYTSLLESETSSSGLEWKKSCMWNAIMGVVVVVLISLGL